jgi:hypothetical protein
MVYRYLEWVAQGVKLCKTSCKRTAVENESRVWEAHIPRELFTMTCKYGICGSYRVFIETVLDDFLFYEFLIIQIHGVIFVYVGFLDLSWKLS